MSKGRVTRKRVTHDKASARSSAAKSEGSAASKTAQRRGKATQRNRLNAKVGAPATGTAWMVAVGWLATVAGAVALAAVVGRGWAAVIGNGFDYVVHPRSTTTPGWPVVAAVFGPLVGFNLIYFGHAPRSRRPAMLGFVVLVGAELLALVVAAVWMLGANQPAADVAGNSGGSALGPLIFILGCCVAAAAIMAWLGGSSTFDQQRDEYFAKRRATVYVTPLGLFGRVAWTLGSVLLVVVLAILPARLAADHVEDRYSSSPQRAWPQPWVTDSDFATVVGLLGVVLGLLLGVCVSMLIKAVLYRTVLSRWAARSSGRGVRTFGLRALRLFHHWPIAVAGLWWSYWLSWGLAENDVGNIDGGITVPLLLGLAPVALGLVLVSQVWRAQNQTGAPRPMRLRMGGVANSSTFS